jgi:hypothetical protein
MIRHATFNWVFGGYMKLIPFLNAAAIALIIGSTAAHAAIVEYDTAGCFGSSCAPAPTTTSHNLKFTGLNNATFSLPASNVALEIALGSFSLSNTGPFNPYAFLGDTLKLEVSFGSPISTVVSPFASVTGFITAIGGLVYIDFNPQEFDFGGGSFKLDIHDVLLTTTLFNRTDIDPLTGTLTMTAAVPEPSTWAMMILGFVGVGFLAHRRRRMLNALAAS